MKRRVVGVGEGYHLHPKLSSSQSSLSSVHRGGYLMAVKGGGGREDEMMVLLF